MALDGEVSTVRVDGVRMARREAVRGSAGIAPPVALGDRIWRLVALGVTALVALPVLSVAISGFTDASAVWSHLIATTLPDILWNTLGMMLGVGIGTSLIGVGTAWLVTMCRFPGSRALEILLLLPMAMPAFIIGYAYADFLTFAGPLQSLIRNLTGLTRGHYWFPNIYSLGGVISMLTFVLYPYVYLMTRAAFLEQSAGVLEAARTLGAGPWKAFFRIAVPLARPAIGAGVALALMEAIADFGTVQYFGLSTFTTAIYRTWFGMGETAVAAQLATTLLVFAIGLITLERLSRGARGFQHTTRRVTPPSPHQLRGWRAAMAMAICGLPVLVGFVLPVGIFVAMAIEVGDPLALSRLAGYAGNSLTLAGLAAASVVAVALLLTYATRLDPGRISRLAARIASSGYAVPGSVVAIGILVPLGLFDNAVDGFMRAHFGVSTGLLLSGSAVALVYAYVVRFLAVGMGPIESGFGKLSKGLDGTARTLGASPWRVVTQVHAPMLRGSVLTAALLVFVDVFKELPATLIVRPFNFDTLAVRIYGLAADERLAQASTGALMIVAVGLVPVLVLSWSIRRRPERIAVARIGFRDEPKTLVRAGS